jgi:glycyl-tRNA synthetase alpha chain
MTWRSAPAPFTRPPRCARWAKPWAAAYVQPSRRPTDGRYGENPNRLQHYYQYQVLIKPSPPDLQELYLGSLEAIGIDMALHDIRFVEDDWESPTLGAWGLGWEVWCDGMEVSQFTYFQQVGGHDCHPVSGELTYGLERLAMYVLGIDHVMDMPFNDPEAPIPLSYGDVFRQTEEEYSALEFRRGRHRDAAAPFRGGRGRMRPILDAPADDPKTGRRIVMAHPAYDQCIKASHIFNLLDARGVISVTERQAYIGRVRALAKLCADAFVQTEAGGRPVRLLRADRYGGDRRDHADGRGDPAGAAGFRGDRRRDLAPALPRLFRAGCAEGLAAAATGRALRGGHAAQRAGLVRVFRCRRNRRGAGGGRGARGSGRAGDPGRVDRVVAVFADGRAYAWHQLNGTLD